LRVWDQTQRWRIFLRGLGGAADVEIAAVADVAAATAGATGPRWGVVFRGVVFRSLFGSHVRIFHAETVIFGAFDTFSGWVA